MNLAINYINKEIVRVNGIIDYQKKVINDVKRGRCGLVNEYGIQHTNTHELEEYVDLKKSQVNKLINWKIALNGYY